MARPCKNNADYFPHDNDMRDDERIKAVRRKFSHLGYSIWNMLLERLCKAEDFRIEYSSESIDIMAGDFNIEPEQLKEIMEYFIKLRLITQQGEIIFSQTMINRFEGLIRKRKRDTERLSLAKTTDERIIADDNTQSKVKESKEKEIEENTKEKGVKEKSPPVFENQKINTAILINTSLGEEKDCAEKEKIILDALPACKLLFLGEAKFYFWEERDEKNLLLLLRKIFESFRNIHGGEKLASKFSDFLQKLPEYWRSKKFTLINLNENFNEIVSEIRSKNKQYVKPVRVHRYKNY